MGEADLDGNGVYDLVTIGREFTGEVRAYNTTDNGSSWNNVWNKTGMTYAMAEIEGFDADSDNKTDEMLLVGFAEIYCVEARNGSVIWSNTSTEIPSLASAAAAVLDLNHDGNRNEVVYSAGYFAPYNLYAVEGDTGDVIWTSDIPMHSSAQYNRELIPADLDNDGWIDDFVVSNYYIHGVNNDSTVLWNFTTPTAYIYSVAVGDLTGDDEVEIVAGGDQGIVWVLNRTGALLWSKDLGQGDIGTALGKGEAISIADFNDDGINDFAVATDLWKVNIRLMLYFSIASLKAI